MVGPQDSTCYRCGLVADGRPVVAFLASGRPVATFVASGRPVAGRWKATVPATVTGMGGRCTFKDVLKTFLLEIFNMHNS